MNAPPFAVPDLISAPNSGAVLVEGWHEETLRYRVRPRRKPKFHSVLNAKALFGDGNAYSEVISRVGLNASGQRQFILEIKHTISGYKQNEIMTCDAENGLVVEHFTRRLDEGPGQDPVRLEEVCFQRGPFKLPPATYPEVTLPFLMRGQPLDQQTRSAWSWTNDRLIARVYYEVRKQKMITVPAGRFLAAEVWLYPNFNDWISLGNLVSRLIKPLLPRYNIWFELAPPHRVLRFEGPYGPPAAPEVELELA